MPSPRLIAATTIALLAAATAGAQPVTQVWVDRYDGSDEGVGGTDRGFDIAFDSQGNAIVVGFSNEIDASSSYLAIKYAPDGTRLWLTPSQAVPQGLAHRMTLDDADNVILVGSANAGAIGGSDFGVLKLDANGNELWSRTYDPGLGSAGAEFEGVVTDSAGAIYTFGTQFGAFSTPNEFHVVRYDSDGTFQWDHLEPASYATGIAVTDDAVYVCGATEVASNDDDLLLLKLTLSGSVVWRRTLGRTANFANDGAVGLGIDSSGNVVAGGTYSGNGGGPGVTTDFAVVRIAPDGTVLSEVAYDGPLNVYNAAWAFALAADDGAIVTGRQTDPSDPGGSSDIHTVKIDPLGNAIWDRAFGGLATFSDIPYDVTADRFGSTYVVGELWSVGPIREYFTIKYDAAGTLEWAQNYGGAANNPSYGLAVAVSSDLLVSVTGYSGAFGPFADSDIATVTYSQPLPTGVRGVDAGSRIALQVVPNPVRLGAKFSFGSAIDARALDILDIRGRRVASIDAAGRGQVQWEPGRSVPSGVYFAQLRAAERAETVKFVLLR